MGGDIPHAGTAACNKVPRHPEQVVDTTRAVSVVAAFQRAPLADTLKPLDEETERQRRDERSRLSRGLSVDAQLLLYTFGMKTAPGVRLGNSRAFTQAG